jgi:catechol 2,3-dioxygenase-like lactoylglutathione lyase family enzyme
VIHALDHVVIAVRDLEAASAGYTRLLGRRPSWRGAHPGAGTANALFRLENTYLELLAQAGEGGLGRVVAARLASHGEGVFALAFASDDLEKEVTRLRAAGCAASEPAPGEGRDSASGSLRRWRSSFLPFEATRGLAAFVIEHLSPASALPEAAVAGDPQAAVAALDHVVVASDDLAAARRFHAGVLGLRLALDRSFEARGLRILFFRVGGATVEIVGPLAPPASAAAQDRFGGLAWRVADVGAARERLVAAGFDVTPLRTGAKPGTLVCTVRAETCGVPTLVIGPG